jgi:hypothetical protein
VDGEFNEVFTGNRQLLNSESVLEMEPGAYLVYEKLRQ